MTVPTGRKTTPATDVDAHKFPRENHEEKEHEKRKRKHAVQPQLSNHN